MLPVETYIRYAQTLGTEPGTEERKELGELPQFYADMHGWDSIVATIGDVYDSLPEADKPQTAVFVSNYGEAGAVDLLGRSRGLPPATSGHNNYWLWGPGDSSPEVVILMAGSRESLDARAAMSSSQRRRTAATACRTRTGAPSGSAVA